MKIGFANVVFFVLPFFSATASLIAQEPPRSIGQYVGNVASEKPLDDALIGVMAVSENGDTLVNYNGFRKLIPASNTKLLTTGLAMYELGPDYRFATSIGHTGKVRRGTLHGDIYVIGGGDPTIASSDSIALPVDSLFSKWKAIIEKAGIKRIKGKIIGDGRYFDGPIVKSSWSYDDLGTDYGTGSNALAFFENVQQFEVGPGSEVGAPVVANAVFPVSSWMTFANKAVTSGYGSGDGLALYDSEYFPYAELQGSYAIDEPSKTENFSNKFGSYTCAHYFCDYLERNHLNVRNGAADITPEGFVRGNLRDSVKVGKENFSLLGTTYSAELKDIVKATLYKSDNLYAETIYRLLGKILTGSASYDSSYVAEHLALRKLGMDVSYGAQVVDGSGLSRHNYISPDFFCRFLRAMAHTDIFEDYLQSLPQAGEGTLKNRLKNLSFEQRRRIFMKSGSMNGVLCYSGYVLPENPKDGDMIYFSIMTNNCTAGSRETASIIDNIIGKIIEN
jgi:D-alanyl-D-alanine carboxypeptidase/D-alanyl-D-alanine-endopeptidase (penicillin-binding protein 4)